VAGLHPGRPRVLWNDPSAVGGSGRPDPGTAPGNGIPFRKSDLPTLTYPPQRPLV